jgi:hypothetical protein
MYYTIDNKKLKSVTRIFNREVRQATEDLIEAEICSDWNEGRRHQKWIDEASPQEIADWIASFYSN